MPEQTSSIISKVWGMCNPLRDDGLSYGDYLEQLTYLIFLKMSDEYSKPPYRKESGIPAGYTWQDMNTLTGAALEEQYKDTLEKLGEQGGILGQIFKGAINKVSNAAILYRIVQMIDREKWVSMSSDVKGEIYEGLLQKNAEDVKSGAGQYFTPRALIQAMVACIRPEPMKTIADPCCGSGTFLIEREKLYSCAGLTGVDISNKAIDIARSNAEAAGSIAKFVHNDCMRFTAERPYDELVANLPFGNRVGSHKSNEKLYAGILENLPKWLRRGGVAILYTMEYTLLKKLIREHPGLRLVTEVRTEAGGLMPAVFVIKIGQ